VAAMARIAGSKGAETAARVRAAATELFAKSGYAAVSMREIAAAAGMQAGSLYNHFPTKQDLLCDLLTGHMEGLIAAWEAEGAARLSPAKALDAFVRFHLRYHLGRSDQVFLASMELRSLEPENFTVVERLRRRYEGFLRDILAAGKAAGVFRIDDVPIATMVIIAMLTGMTTWYRRDGRLPLDRIETIYTGMVARSVGLEEEECSTPA
jgi:AcrR family transcriptional regulator